MDSFDVYKQYSDLTFQYIISTSTDTGISTTGGRFGQGAYFSEYYAAYIQKNFNANYSNIWMGIAINTNDAGGVTVNDQYSFILNGDKSVFVFQSNNGMESWLTYNNLLGVWKFFTHTPSVGSPVPILNAYSVYQTGTFQWHWLEIHYIANSVNGTFEIWVDDVQIMNFTGSPTTSWGGNQINGIYIGAAPLSLIPSTLFAYYDDWYVLDSTTGPYNTTRIGDSRIYSLVPVSDVAGHNNGQPSSGTNYFAMVDEPQNDGLTTYITIAGTPGNEDIFNMSHLPSTPNIIFGCRVLNIVEQTAGGTITGNAIIVSNSVIANGNTQPLLSVFFSQYNIFEKDPSTNAPWTYEAINAAQCGFIVASS
jgi:hypothetical protein